MAEYEPIFTQNGGAPPPPPALAPPPPPKKKGKKKKKVADSIVQQPISGRKKDGGGGQDEGGDEEEFAQSAYSNAGAAGEDGGRVKQTTACGRVCCYLLVANMTICSIGAAGFTVMFLTGVPSSIPFLSS